MTVGALEFATKTLHSAAESGDVAAVRAALQSGAPAGCVDENGWPALDKAAAGGHLEVCRALVAAGAAVRPGASDWTALQRAAFRGDSRACRVLVQAGVDVDALDMGQLTALCYAALRGHAPVCSVLLEAGAQVEVAGCPGSAVHVHARSARVKALLAAHGARRAARDAVCAVSMQERR